MNDEQDLECKQSLESLPCYTVAVTETKVTAQRRKKSNQG